MQLGHLSRSSHYLQVQLHRYVWSFTFNDLLYSALPSESIIIVPLTNQLDQLLGCDQIVQDNDLTLALVDEAFVLLSIPQQIVQMTDQFLCTPLFILSLIMSNYAPKIFELLAVSLLIFLGYFNEFWEVCWLFVVVIVGSVEEVDVCKSGQIFNFLFYYWWVFPCNRFHFLSTISQQSFASWLTDPPKQFEKESTEVNFSHQDTRDPFSLCSQPSFFRVFTQLYTFIYLYLDRLFESLLLKALELMQRWLPRSPSVLATTVDQPSIGFWSCRLPIRFKCTSLTIAFHNFPLLYI